MFRHKIRMGKRVSRRDHRNLLVFTNQAFAVCVLVLLAIGPAAAHNAPSGWMYDLSCCGSSDCAPEKAEVKATAVGWLITSTGETIPYGDSRIHESKDGDFHRCHVFKQNLSIDETRCLYVPPMGL